MKLLFLLRVDFQSFKRGVTSILMGSIKFIKHTLHLSNVGNSVGLNVGQEPSNMLLSFLGRFWAADGSDVALRFQSPKKLDNLFQSRTSLHFNAHDRRSAHTSGLNSLSENVSDFIQAVFDQFFL